MNRLACARGVIGEELCSLVLTMDAPVLDWTA